MQMVHFQPKYFQLQKLLKIECIIVYTIKKVSQFHWVIVVKFYNRIVIKFYNRMQMFNILKHLKRTLRSELIFDNWKPFKNDEKCFLFHLISSFCSQDI